MGSPGRGKAFAAARPEGAPAPARGPGFVHDVQHAREIRVRRAGNLEQVNKLHIGTYVVNKSPLKGGRDVSEACTLAEIMDFLKEGRHAQAMDVAAGRMMSLEVATQPGKDHKAGAEWECKAPNYATLAGQ